MSKAYHPLYQTIYDDIIKDIKTIGLNRVTSFRQNLK